MGQEVNTGVSLDDYTEVTLEVGEPTYTDEEKRAIRILKYGTAGDE